jgi:hypothetical protein
MTPLVDEFRPPVADPYFVGLVPMPKLSREALLIAVPPISREAQLIAMPPVDNVTRAIALEAVTSRRR